MASDGNGAPGPEEWARERLRTLRLEDALECGWSRETAALFFRVLFPGRDSATVEEVRTLLDDERRRAELVAQAESAPGAPAGLREASSLFPRLASEMLAYRIEREEVVIRYQRIRFTRVNLKLVPSGEMPPAALKALGRDLGWKLREDEEGVTVPVDQLLPYFRRPIVRRLLDAKLAKAGLL